MNEEAIRFGEDERLCGIVAQPDEAAGRDRPAVIFVSAGLLPKSGPYRMYTEFARSVTAVGFRTMRLDLSGNGDSLGALTVESADRTTVADTRLAMDELQQRFGVDEFILFGLCSGAEASHKTALQDPRVVGLVTLDGFIARNFRFYLWHYLPRLFSPRKWQDFLRQKTRRLLGRRRNDDYPHDADVEFWDDQYPSRDQIAREHTELCRRNVRQLLIYSGGSGLCSYPGQFRDVFKDVPFDDLIEVRFFRDADHTYILREDRRELHQAVCRWFRSLHRESAAVPLQQGTTIGRRKSADVIAASFNRTISSVERRGEKS